MNFLSERFENNHSLLEALQRPLNKIWQGTTPSTERMDADFHGANNFAEALSLFENGDLALAKKIKDIKLPSLNNEREKKQRVYSPIGGSVCIPKFLASNPYCMRRAKKIRVSDKVLSLYYNASVSCRYSAEEVLTVNKKLLDMVNSLTLDGYSIQVYYLNFSQAYSGKTAYTFIYKLKSFQEAFNVARSAFVLGSPAMLRGIWFRYIEHCTHELESRFAYGYGRPYYPNKQELVKNGIIKQEDVLVDFQKLENAKQATDLLQE